MRNYEHMVMGADKKYCQIIERSPDEYKAKRITKGNSIAELSRQMLTQVMVDLARGDYIHKKSCRDFVECGGHEFYCRFANVDCDRFKQHVLKSTETLQEVNHFGPTARKICVHDMSTGEKHYYGSIGQGAINMGVVWSTFRGYIDTGRLLRGRYTIVTL